MEITLVRHGKPNIPATAKIHAHELYRWIDAYNLANLDTRHEPPEQLITLVQQCNTIVCSDLRRSLHSAELLGVKNINRIDAIFREVELPYATMRSPKLSPATWSVIFRILWFMGYAENSEPKDTARQKATNAANILHELALRNDSVVLIGHSIFNNFIARQLQIKGWRGCSSIFSKHWEISKFEYMK